MLKDSIHLIFFKIQLGFPSKWLLSLCICHCSLLKSRVLVLGAVRLNTNLSSSSMYSSCAKWAITPIKFQSLNSVRKIWTRGPLCMGRRSCKIAGRKVRIHTCFRLFVYRDFTTEIKFKSRPKLISVLQGILTTEACSCSIHHKNYMNFEHGKS